MSEKVLGFRKKDAMEYGVGAEKHSTFSIDSRKLVPVVSIAWLEKWCEKNKKNGLKAFDEKGFPVADYVLVGDLLATAKKQAGK